MACRAKSKRLSLPSPSPPPELLPIYFEHATIPVADLGDAGSVGQRIPAPLKAHPALFVFGSVA